LTRAIGDQTRTLRASLRDSSLDVDQLRWGRHWLSHLRRGVLEAEAELGTHRAMLAQERDRLIESRKETQVLARLKERRREAYLAEAARAEQIETDEMNASRFARMSMIESEATA